MDAAVNAVLGVPDAVDEVVSEYALLHGGDGNNGGDDSNDDGKVFCALQPVAVADDVVALVVPAQK